MWLFAKILFARGCKLLRAQSWQLVWVRVALLLLGGNSWIVGSMMEQLMLKEGIAQGRLHIGVVAAEHRLWQGSPWGCCNSSMYP